MLERFVTLLLSPVRFILRDVVALRVAKALIAIDLLFIIVHGVKYLVKEQFIDQFGYWIYRNLTITNDWAFPEMTNYLKFAALVVLLACCFRKRRQPIYLAWAFVYLVALVDDSMQVHENLGGYIGETLAGSETLAGALRSNEGMRLQDIGELAVYAIYGVSFAVSLGFGFLRAKAEDRRIGVGLGVLFLSLAAFVAGVDMIDRLTLAYSHTLSLILATIEDGGEMVVISLTVALAVSLLRLKSDAAQAVPTPASVVSELQPSSTV